jgi:tetratricopeptide (TPR) repeat protein
LAVIFLLINKEDEAIKRLETALKYNPKHADTYEHLEQVYIKLDEHEKSVEMFSVAITQKSNVAHYYFCRGWSYRFLGKLENSVADFTRAHELDSENEKYSESMRDVKEEIVKNGMYDKIQKHLTGNAPKDQIYTSKDVQNDIDRHEWKSAIEKCDKILMRNADDFETRVLRASILVDAYSDYASAISDYGMAVYYAHNNGDKRYSEYKTAEAKTVEKIEKLFPNTSVRLAASTITSC